jgi:integrase
MYLEFKPNGSKLCKMAYSPTGKQKTLSFGPYPLTTLAKARERRDEAKTLLLDGIDPMVHARELEAERQTEFGNFFADIAAELLDKNRKEGPAEVTLRKKAWLVGLANKDLAYKPIALIAPKVTHRAAIVERDEYAALKLMAILYPRPGELWLSAWPEWDLEKRIWTIPAERTKMRREHGKRLPGLAVEILTDLR